MAAGGMKIAEAIKSIPEKKEKLRKAWESLQSFSSSASLTANFIEWKDLEDHFSAIEKSIEERFKVLPDKDKITIDDSTAAMPMPSSGNLSDEATPRPELRSVCVNMDAKGLLSYIFDNRDDIDGIREELAPAIRCAPDPALLVLDAMETFYPPNSISTSKSKSNSKKRAVGGDKKEGGTHFNRGTCISLLDKLRLISPDIKPSVREKAKRLAIEWKAKIPDSGDNALEAMGLLQLISSYSLISEFALDDVMELFFFISRRKQAIDLIKNLGLTDKLPDLIQKLSSKGRQIDAVKFVYAFNVVDKFPPVPLLKAYITESKKIAQEVRKKGNNSARAQNEATAKEVGALKSVLKAVEEYKLETEYSRDGLVKRITQLEQKVVKKRTATAAAASNSKPQQQQANKRPRPSSATSAAVIAANPYPLSIQTQPQLGLADRAPYIGVAGPYGLAATGSVYNQGGLSGTAVGHGGIRSPPRSYYSSESLLGTNSLYDRAVTYNGYLLSGLPSSYGSSLYP